MKTKRAISIIEEWKSEAERDGNTEAAQAFEMAINSLSTGLLESAQKVIKRRKELGLTLHDAYGELDKAVSKAEEVTK